ncbi:hypothetical protein FA95DRAFT_1490308 [Auriscalpium vulgare]|uniref:Uncharacterized protein n=1 Tax=Auriscalpium vulgare TaxID=40419 RepID=A0ACB8RY16_9AGAM|nr:hypothetical protein FA95DRAFT_1490308 [Auriscalpium vulgare]
MLNLNEFCSSRALVLITDELASPADFLLHQLVIGHLKGRPSNKCVVASPSGDLDRWKAVSLRSGIDVAQKLEDKSFAFLSLGEAITPSTDGAEHVVLSAVLGSIREAVEGAGTGQGVMVILDDTAILEWIGHSTAVITRFCRSLVSLCTRVNASLIIRHHVVNPEEPDPVLRTLFQLCSYHVEVRPLSSGKSGAVSGQQVAIHAGASLDSDPKREIPRGQALQYRLNDYNAVYFERGTGAAVL